MPVLATWDNHDCGSHNGGVEFPLKEMARTEFLDFFGKPRESERRRFPGIHAARILGSEGRRVQLRNFSRRPAMTRNSAMHWSAILVLAGACGLASPVLAEEEQAPEPSPGFGGPDAVENLIADDERLTPAMSRRRRQPAAEIGQRRLPVPAQVRRRPTRRRPKLGAAEQDDFWPRSRQPDHGRSFLSPSGHAPVRANA
jgi:hypothetical protein